MVEQIYKDMFLVILVIIGFSTVGYLCKFLVEDSLGNKSTRYKNCKYKIQKCMDYHGTIKYILYRCKFGLKGEVDDYDDLQGAITAIKTLKKVDDKYFTEKPKWLSDDEIFMEEL